jgi:cytochrome P450
MGGSYGNTKICDVSIREYKANVKPGSRKDSLSTLIASRDDDGTGLSHEELVGTASIFIFAGNSTNYLTKVLGVETTATALTYIAYILGKHPEYFENLAEEVSQYKDVDHLHSIELEKLPLLNAVIRESMRLYPPAPGPIGRVSPPEGTTLSGYFIPGGVHIADHHL